MSKFKKDWNPSVAFFPSVPFELFIHVQIQEGLKHRTMLDKNAKRQLFIHVQIQEGLKRSNANSVGQYGKLFIHVQIQEGLKLILKITIS